MVNSNYMTTAAATGVNATAVHPESYNNTPLSALVLTVYSKDIEMQAQPVLRFDQFAENKVDLSANPGDTISFFKYNNLSRGGALTEGTPMTTQALSGSQVSISVTEYGNAVSASELLIQTAFDNIMSSTARLLAYDYATLVDELARDVLETSSNVVLAGNVASVDTIATTGVLTLEEIKDGVETLATNLTQKINNDHYVCFVHPHQSRGLRDDPNWITVGKLDPQRLYNGEIGRVDDVVFVETTQVSIDANSAATPLNVYTAIMIGANAFARAVALPVQMRDNGVIDFQRERQLAWYSIMGQGVLNEDNIVLIKTA